MRRLVLSLCVAALGPHVLGAEGTGPSLAVRVRDPHGAVAPGADARLSARDGRLHVTSPADGDGVCRFTGIPAGDYLLDAGAPGFSRSRPIGVAVTGSAPLEMEVRLSAAAFEEHMVVTAAGTLQTSDETAKAIGVLDGADLDARGEVWLPDALRGIPGVFVQSLGGPGSFTSIKSRGLRNEDTAILIDGVPLRDAAAPQGDAAAFLGDMPLASVDRIEILRGSGSSLHGSHAVGGAVNVITRAGGKTTAGALLFEAGGLGLARARARLAGGRGAMAYSLGFTHVDVSRGIDGDDAARQAGAQGRLDLRLPARASLTLSFFGVEARGRVNESPEALGPLPAAGVIDAAAGLNFKGAANDPDHGRDSRFLSARVAFEQRLAPPFGYTLAYQDVSTRRTYRDGPLGATAFEPAGPTRSDYDGRARTLSARADIRWSARHTTTASVELAQEALDTRALPAIGVPPSSVDVTQSSRTAFVQHQVQPLARLHVTGAVRAQSFSLRTPAFAPIDRAPYQGVAFSAPPGAYTAEASAAYLLGTGTKLRAHAGNGYRAPSLYERFGTFFGGFGYSVYGDPRLRPERSHTFDAGADQDLLGGRVRASATYFHTRLGTVIAFETFDGAARAVEPFARSRGYRNAEGRPARGVELGLTAAPVRGLRLVAAYTHTDAEPRHGQPADLPQAYAVPRRVFAAAALYARGRWQGAVDVTAASAHLAPLYDIATFTSRAFRFDGHVDVDAVASYTWPVAGGRLRAFARLENAAGTVAYEQGFATPGRLGYAGASFEF